MKFRLSRDNPTTARRNGERRGVERSKGNEERGGKSNEQKGWWRAETRCRRTERNASERSTSSIVIIGVYIEIGVVWWRGRADDRQATASISATKDSAGWERRESECDANEWRLANWDEGERKKGRARERERKRDNRWILWAPVL